ncbi:MAG: 50S ribosomal protein L11 methyltransferase [Myxococcales bacterium]|jgi:ribosomal protein L11 methyltransferase
MSTPPRHALVTLRLRPDQVELAELRLWELGATGLEERDDTTIVCEPTPGQVVVMAAFPDEPSARRALSELRQELEAEITYVPHEDWSVEWRRGFAPQRIGRRLVLQPSWERARSRPGDVVVTIDPENAFGSGDHETTRLVLSILEQRVAGGESVLDVGCGSGILSIAAILLGAESAIAIDVDSDAVVVTRRNAGLNGVKPRISASTRPLADVVGRYDIVVANIETRVLVDMADALRRRVAPDGYLILSGILREERDALLAAYGSMELEVCFEEGSWCACVLRLRP